MTDLYSFGTPFGGVKVAKEASEDFQGLIEELAQAGAPIKNIGSYNYRNIAGTNVLSEHGRGKAIDIGDQQARNVVDPAFRDWVEENPQRYSQILAKYNMRGGETFSNPDLGHVEWKGEGYGNPLREAAPIGGAMPENYNTEDRTAAGIGLVPRDEDVASTPSGQKRMANGDGSQGILPLLGMQNQQPQGLLGALGDPETMAYIGMMLKGMNPYSQIDPNAMLSSAHANALRKEALRQQMAERATDNTRADRALNLREQEYGLSRSEREDRNKALQSERATDNQRADQALKLNQDKFEESKITDAVRAAKDQGLEPGTPEYKDYITKYYANKTKTRTSVTPTWGVGADGKPVIGQLNEAGEFVPTKMPEGVTPAKGTFRIDAGTYVSIRDSLTGQEIGREAKDIAGAAQQKEVGTQTGKAQVGLPQALQTADDTIKQIDEIISHPGRETGTGLSSKLDPRNYIPGTDAYNFAVRVRQVGGRAFLQAYETLKGTGQITEIEGMKATDAIARMDKAQSDEEFLQAMNDFKGVINGIKTNLRKKAGMPEEASSSGGGNTTRDALKSKYGLE